MAYPKTDWENYEGSPMDENYLNKIENELEKLDLDNGHSIGVSDIVGECWVKLATITFSDQGESAIINCVSGDGQNGENQQNTVFQIVLKQGWQEMEYPIGFTVNFFQNHSYEYKFKLKHLTKFSAEIYIYLPFAYNDLTYTISGVYTSFVRNNERLSSEPQGDKEATIYADGKYLGCMNLGAVDQNFDLNNLGVGETCYWDLNNQPANSPVSAGRTYCFQGYSDNPNYIVQVCFAYDNNNFCIRTKFGEWTSWRAL